VEARPRYVSTEAGLRLLRATLRNYIWEARLSVLPRGRIQQTFLGTSDPRDLAVQAGFLRLVSVVEASVDSLAVELTEGNVPRVDEVLRLLMLEKEIVASANWESRRRVFKRHHRVDLRKCPRYSYLEGAIEVRNAIAHRLGRLTTRQAMSVETTHRLRIANVIVVNERVDLTSEHLTECANCSSEFLRSLDALVP